MDNGIRRIVYAICSDYSRRAKLINRGRLPQKTAETYSRMNNAIDSAVNAHADPGERAMMMRTLQDRRGYLEGLDICGKNQFYKRKAIIVEEIAKMLDLV